jgi:hypothetical protein
MIQTAFGLPSEGKSFTHEQNMANAEIPDLTFLSKRELKSLIVSLSYEIEMLKRKHQEDMERLRVKTEEWEAKYDKMRAMVLDAQREELKSLKEQIAPVMKIAV